MKNNDLSPLKKTARITGVFYLLLAITGMFGFLIFHSKIYDPANAATTLSNLVEKQSLARTRLFFEFGIVISQALTAVWFYRLFRTFNGWASAALLIWGTVNALVILISALAMGAAIDIAAATAWGENDRLLAVQILQLVISHAWATGALFFGLWLIPMGYVVEQSRVMPLWLGRILMIGGVGYVLSAFVGYAGFRNVWTDVMTVPASVGEFWMIAYLLIYGIRPVSGEAVQYPELHAEAGS